ncbi:MAG: ATP-dependent Clp protease adaptor ClpS [Nitrospinota bacterium]|nr:ATP-dependent Clp protease adaptor ClpS [Nitrospinota bacterium]
MKKEDPLRETQEGTDSQVILIPQHKVILHNDDITPMDFVISVIVRFFSLEHEKAREVMIEAHKSGYALVAIMPLERAEFKVEQAHNYARGFDYPLTFTIEPV